MADLNCLAKILGVDEMMLENLDKVMSKKTGRVGVLEKIGQENEDVIENILGLLNSSNRSASHVKSVLRQTILNHEKQLLAFLEIIVGKNEFEKAAVLAKKIISSSQGLFLKKEKAIEILKKRPSQNLLIFLKASSIDEVLKNYDVMEIFSSLRFIETDEWMHKTFEEAYGGFTHEDFEKREIEIRVLSETWKDVAVKFVAKKHHNVSHLKEFGVIFINPIRENIPGKF
ncbi:MAG: hypothetical protein AAB621_00940, partial [Patescibacteria group bacterium]